MHILRIIGHSIIANFNNVLKACAAGESLYMRHILYAILSFDDLDKET